MTPEHPRPYQAHDEIDLFELAQDLWKQKWLILLITGVCTALAAAYALLAAPVYQASARLLPPLNMHIAPLNQMRVKVGLPELTAEEVYTLVKRNLTSGSNHAWLFNEHYQPYSEEQNAGMRNSRPLAISETLQVRQAGARSNPQLYSVSVTLPGDPTRAAEWVALYLEYVAERTLSELTDDVEYGINSRVSELEQRITALRELARNARQDRIVQLKDALIIAEAAGEGSPTTMVLGSEVAAGTTDIYLRDTQAIQSAIALLEAREDDDPFIPELRELQQQHEALMTLDKEVEGVTVFTIDSPATAPSGPIKPRKNMIIALGVVLGGMLGVGVALVRMALRSRRETQD